MAPKRKQLTTSSSSSSKAKSAAVGASSSSSKAKSAAVGALSSSPPSKKTRRQQVKVKPLKVSEESDFAKEPELEVVDLEDEDGAEGSAEGERSSSAPARRKPKRRGGKKNEEEVKFLFLDKPIPKEEARRRWPYRFQVKTKGKLIEKEGSKSSNGEDDSDELIEARFHFRRAQVDGYIYNLEDDAYVQGEDGKDNYICKIVEMFEAVDGVLYFRAQWFYRTRDTIITECHEELIDAKRVFFSEVQDDNFLDCLVKPLNIARSPNMDLKRKKKAELNFDYFYDMMYLLPHCTFMSLRPDDAEGAAAGSETDSTISSEVDIGAGVISGVEVLEEEHNLEMTLLDLYSGCGAMSTGLSLGANSAGVKLVTKWAVDLNKYACKSLKWNHPETEVANEYAHNYLCLLQEWQMLCASFSLVLGNNIPQHPLINVGEGDDSPQEDEEDEEDEGDDSEEVFEVEKVLDICYGDPRENNNVGLHFKIRWKGYGPDYDTWEPLEGLSNCQEKVKDFVTKGYQRKILPLPGMVDVICGGPPCQGISGFNRFRNKEEPLQDEKNKQLVVFMDIVAFLKPRYVLMENVVDLFRFASGYLGRYAFARLVQMNYQARLGLMAAGAYGLAQFRMRAFLWAALPTENLPQYPLPTHDLVVRGNVPKEFESCFVAYEEGHKVNLEEKLFLEDVISDLPPVENDESRDELQYMKPKTEFQKFIRLRKNEMPGSLVFGLESSPHLLYDHRPFQLNDDDYSRVCRVPKKKGANFRDLPGLQIGPDNKVEFDPEVERELLPSGKPLVPDYAMTFIRGTSSKPFGRLWWDETVPTVVTRAEPHNQIICHPTQDRVLTVRENARLQGFPDYYKLFGPIKERYIQVGNAVAVPVARALGHSLACASKGLWSKEPVFTLPKKFPYSLGGNPELFS